MAHIKIVAETSTWQHTTFTTDRHMFQWDSNPQSQQRNGGRPMS